MILDETLEVIKLKYGERFNSVTIELLIAGIYFTAVRLSSGFSGLAYTMSEPADCCSHNRSRGFGDFTPGSFKGQKIAGLFAHPDPSFLVKNVQLAVLNALSAELITKPGYRIIENQDPFDLLELGAQKKVCVVGAFLSYIKKTAESASTLQIVELNEEAVPDEYKSYLVPAVKSEEAIAGADIVIITGSTLANHTLDDLLKNISAKAQVILVGPTSSLLPDVLFRHGINLVGATRITDSEKMFQLVAEGASGFHLFKSCADKICLVNES